MPMWIKRYNCQKPQERRTQKHSTMSLRCRKLKAKKYKKAKTNQPKILFELLLHIAKEN